MPESLIDIPLCGHREAELHQIPVKGGVLLDFVQDLKVDPTIDKLRDITSLFRQNHRERTTRKTGYIFGEGFYSKPAYIVTDTSCSGVFRRGFVGENLAPSKLLLILSLP